MCLVGGAGEFSRPNAPDRVDRAEIRSDAAVESLGRDARTAARTLEQPRRAYAVDYKLDGNRDQDEPHEPRAYLDRRLAETVQVG